MTETRFSLILAAAVAGLGAAGSGAPVRVGLEEAIALARAAAPELRSLTALERASDARIEEARRIRRPWFEAEATYTRLSSVPELTVSLPGETPRTIFADIRDAWRTRVTAAVPLYTGGRVDASVEAARGDREAARAETVAGDADLALETTRAFWRLATARETVSVLDEAMAAYDQHVADSIHREETGLAPRSEVLSVRVERDRAELELIEARSEAAVAEADLVRRIGLAPGTAVEPAEIRVLPEAPVVPLEDLIGVALAARPERGALEGRRRALESLARASDAERRPEVAAVAGYDLANPNRRVLPLERAWEGTWDASVSLAWRFADGGRSAASARRLRAEADSLSWRLASLDDAIRLEVTARKLDLDAAIEAVAVADHGVEAAAEALRIVRDRHNEGLASSSERLDAEAALLHAKLDRSSSLARARLAKARLDRATGR